MSVHSLVQSTQTISFEDFWVHYPRKIAKFAAKKSFEKLTAPEKLQAVTAIPRHIEYWRTSASSIQFVPHASTWLNQKRFEDELECELPARENCYWPGCKSIGIKPRGSGFYCEHHFDTLQRGGTPPR